MLDFLIVVSKVHDDLEADEESFIKHYVKTCVSRTPPRDGNDHPMGANDRMFSIFLLFFVC